MRVFGFFFLKVHTESMGIEFGLIARFVRNPVANPSQKFLVQQHTLDRRSATQQRIAHGGYVDLVHDGIRPKI